MSAACGRATALADRTLWAAARVLSAAEEPEAKESDVLGFGRVWVLSCAKGAAIGSGVEACDRRLEVSTRDVRAAPQKTV